MRGSPLTVLHVAYPFAPVSPDSVGGAEQIVATLDRHLTFAGHFSIIAGAQDSSVAGTLIPTRVPDVEFTPAIRTHVQQAHRATVQHALTLYRPDVVHIHAIDPLAYLPSTSVPVLITLHLPLGWYAPEVFASSAHLNCVSESQCGERPIEVIPNGVDPMAGAPHARSLCVAIGRICPEKGFHHALMAAHRAEVPLLLAGQVFPYPEHTAYFDQCIQPLLDRKRRFIGRVGADAKRRLLARARCLLIPSLVAETSSLVAMEALMMGVPVIAFRNGALPEIVEHGVTGFLVSDEAEMEEAIGATSRIDSEQCRRIARERFSSGAMVSRYIETYRRIAHGS